MAVKLKDVLPTAAAVIVALTVIGYRSTVLREQRRRDEIATRAKEAAQEQRDRLGQAVREGDLASYKTLLARIPPDSWDAVATLACASLAGHTAILQHWCSLGRPFPRSLANDCLWKGASFNHPSIVRFALSHGTDANMRTQDARCAFSTVLFDAAAGKEQDSVRALIEHGADVNAVVTAPAPCQPPPYAAHQRDYRGWTPLMMAAAQGRIATVKLLVAHGARPFYRTPNGQSALSLARAQPPKIARAHRCARWQLIGAAQSLCLSNLGRARRVPLAPRKKYNGPLRDRYSAGERTRAGTSPARGVRRECCVLRQGRGTCNTCQETNQCDWKARSLSLQAARMASGGPLSSQRLH
jgi:hypothetical protein